MPTTNPTNTMTPRDVGNTIVMLLDALGCHIHLETVSGVLREGKLTGWSCNTVRVNGKDCPLPHTLELNGDPTDVIAINTIRSIVIDKRVAQSTG
jgi:hypothetical protein